MLTAYAQGVGTGAGLIIAIGAQNAFVLTQGIKKITPCWWQGYAPCAMPSW